MKGERIIYISYRNVVSQCLSVSSFFYSRKAIHRLSTAYPPDGAYLISPSRGGIGKTIRTIEQKITMRTMRAIKKRNEDIRSRFYELIRQGEPMMKAYEQVGEAFYLEARTIREIVAKKE